MSDAMFEIYQDAAGEFRWRLRHDNGNIIADSGQGYSTRQKCKQGMMSVKKHAGGALHTYTGRVDGDADE